MTDEEKQRWLDFGALGYDAETIARVEGVSVSEADTLLEAGETADLYAQGEARFRFAIDQKLMQMAASGDLKALAKLESRKRSKSAGFLD